MPKSVVISCGPIPARLDSVKYITNRFKGGLAFKTAEYLANQGFDLTIVTWTHTANAGLPGNLNDNPNVKEIVRVKDVFDYYNWFEANAKNYDAFIMAAAVANLTPVKPYEGKFPSHNYQPGDEFDIKFMIAPRAIDIVKKINPRACLIGYKLFDTDSDQELIEIARHTLTDSKANIIFANTPHTAKYKKLAVMPDNSVTQCDFAEHLELIKRAIEQEYYKTVVEPMTAEENYDPDIQEALATVLIFEQTFKPNDGGRKYGTVAVPVANHPGMFATTGRGHKGYPVLVRRVDFENKQVFANDKATLNAPALAAMLDRNHIIIHRHFDDVEQDDSTEDFLTPQGNIVARLQHMFPGTVEESKAVQNMIRCDVILERNHGYLMKCPIRTVNWERYYDTFPDKYFGVSEKFNQIVDRFRDRKTLEVGGNKRTTGLYAYDRYVQSETSMNLTWEDIQHYKFDLIFIRNAICYLTVSEIQTLLNHCNSFIANAFAKPPENIKLDTDEASVLDHRTGEIRHTLRLPDDSIMRHRFFAYSSEDYKKLGLTVTPYGRNSILITKNLQI